jgi:hypothetical protein
MFQERQRRTPFPNAEMTPQQLTLLAPRDLARNISTGFSRSPEAARWNLVYLPYPFCPYHRVSKFATWQESELPIYHHYFLKPWHTRLPNYLRRNMHLPTIQVLLFARLLAERIASKGRPDLSQMINLLPRNRICSRFISLPVNVRPTLSPPRSPIFCRISSCECRPSIM